MRKLRILLIGMALALAFLGISASAQQLGRHVVLTSVQTVSYTATSAATSDALGGSGIAVVLVLCTTDCHVTSGASPTATTSDTLIPAMVLVWVWVNGGVDKLAFVRRNTSGTAYVTEAP